MKKRLFLKSVIWRSLALISSFVIALLLGVPFSTSLWLTIVLNLWNWIMYFSFDLFWGRYGECIYEKLLKLKKIK